MELTQIYSNAIARVEADIKQKYIQVTWLKHPKSEEFRDVHTNALSYAYENHLTAWLCDMRQVSYLEVGDQNWLVREIFSGFNPDMTHEFAFVVSHLGLELMSSFRVHDLVRNDQELQKLIKTDIFLDIKSAQMWLFQMGEK